MKGSQTEKPMEVGLQKLHENEWLVHIGCAKIKMDRFSVALLEITLEHLIASEKGEKHSTLQGYVRLGSRIKELSDLHLQKLLREINNESLLMLLKVSKDNTLSERVLKNVGAIMAKQLERDLQNNDLPADQEAKDAIRQVVEATFKLEANGDIEFIGTDVRYI